VLAGRLFHARPPRRVGPDGARAARVRLLVEQVAQDTGLRISDARRAVDSVIATVQKALKKGEDVSLTGFGKFSVVKRAARKGVNPRTREPVRIRASKAAKFTPVAGLKGDRSRAPAQVARVRTSRCTPWWRERTYRRTLGFARYDLALQAAGAGLGLRRGWHRVSAGSRR
jgi:DNA-binding protein HU-beta